MNGEASPRRKRKRRPVPAAPHRHAQVPMPRGFYVRHVVGVWLIAFGVFVPGGPSVWHGVMFAAGIMLLVWAVVSAARSGALGHSWRARQPGGPATYGDWAGHGGHHGHGGDSLGGFVGGDFGGGGGGHHGG